MQSEIEYALNGIQDLESTESLQRRIAELETQLRQAQANAAEHAHLNCDQVEAELRANEARYRQTSLMFESLFDAIPDILGIQDSRHGILHYNRAGYEFFHLSPDQVTGKKCFEVIGRTEPCTFCATREVYETLKPARVEKHLEDRNLWLDVRAYPVLDEAGELLMVIEHLRDVTDRKRAEAALRESEQRYRLLAENTTDVILTLDMDLNITYVSPAVKRLRGYEVEEALAQPLYAALTPTSLQAALKAFSELQTFLQQSPGSAPSTRTLELELTHKDGGTLWTETALTPLCNAEGKPWGILVAVHDISARKKAEEALRENEGRYRLLAENTTDVIWTVDMNLRFTYVSPAVKRLRGYEAQEAAAQPLVEILAPDSLNLALATFQQAHTLEQSPESDPFRSRALELELIRKDGSTVWTETTITFLRDAADKPRELLGVSRDLTARRQAKLTRQRRLLYEQLLSALAAMAINVDNLPTFLDTAMTAIGQTLAVSRAYIFEHRHETNTIDNTIEWCAPGISSQKATLQNVPGDLVPWWMETLLARQTICFSDIEDVPDLGAREVLREQQVLSIWVAPLFVAGQYFGFIGFDQCDYHREWPPEDTAIILSMSRIIANVVERKRAEDNLRASEARYRSLIEQSSDAIYLLHGNRFELVNRRFEELLGVTNDDIRAPDFDVRSLVAPQSRALIEERQRALAAGQATPTRYEFTALNRAGQEIEVEASVSTIAYHDRVATQGILRDISERKQAQRAQQLQLERGQRQQATVVALSLHPAFVNGDVAAASRFLTETVATTFEVSRAGVWLLEKAGSEIRCYDLYLRDEGSHQSGEVLAAANYPTYFAALRQGRAIDAYDACADPRTREFTATYFQSTGVVSVLDAALRLSGELAGVISIEHTGEKHQWQADEITFAGAIADQLAQAFANARRAQTEKQLRESEARFRALAENIPGAVYLQGSDGSILYLNQAVETLTGYPRGVFLDCPNSLMALTHPDDAAAVTQTVKDALACQRAFHLLYRLRHNNGSWRWVEEWGAGIYDGAELVFVEGFLADITERRTLETQLRRQEQLAAIGQLAAGIAHDFRNLLTTITLYAHLGQRQPNLPPALNRYLSIIAGETNKAADLVEQILDFSRRTELDRRPLDLVGFVGSVIAVLQRTLPENIHITLNVGAGSQVVAGDAGRLQQALTNLALNARDAMPQGGELHIGLTRIPTGPGLPPPVPAMAETLAPPAWICLSVTDTGSGMSPEVQAQLFQPFFTTKEEGKGTGLGLAQVYGIVQLHSGYIDVISTLDQGTTFRIYLPAAAGELESEAIAAPRIPLGRGETLLLVEDNSHLREASQNMLTDLGYRVIVAGNGREALELLQTAGPISLLITDLVMPEMGGKVLLQNLREAGSHLPALVMTGHTTSENVETLRAIGFRDVIRKPFDVDTLAKTIRRVLDEHA